MSISRRNFVKGMAVAGGAALISQSPIGCSGIQRSEFHGLNGERTIPGLVDEELGDVLYYASLAPSGHNTQPWGVRVLEPNNLIILSEKGRWLPAVDPNQRETLLSIGAFGENLSQAAGAYGYGVDFEVTAEASNDTEITRITLAKQNTRANSLQRISRRRTVRNGFSDRELSSQDVRAITEGDVDHFHYYPASSPQSRYLDDATVEANRGQVARDEAQSELAEWIRWSDGDAKRNRDGLTPEGMEITGLAGWYVRHFYDKDNVLSKGFREKTIEGVIEQTQKHGGWLVITSTEQDVPTLLETGQRFERMFLIVRDRNIAIHPMTQVLEEAPFRDQVAQELGLNSHVQFLLRVGYLDNYPDPVTLRRPVSWFVQR